MGSIAKPTGGAFTGSTLEVSFTGFLFDMDGTIIDSTPAVEKHWESIGNEIGVSPEVILETSHGRRSIDVLKILAPEKANWDYVMHLEALMPKLYGSDAVEIPGARSLCAALSAPSPTAAPWAIVTSGTTPLVSGWMTILSLPTPGHVIAAEMVEHGKPSPEGYLKGAEELGLAPEGLLVLEDSPAGIKAGKAAGCRVLAVTTTHTAEQVAAAGADWVVKDLQSVKIVRMDGGKAVLQIENIWKSESITGSML